MQMNTEKPLERVQVWFRERPQSTSNVIINYGFLGKVRSIFIIEPDHSAMTGRVSVCMFAIGLLIKQ
jgi:hypothetical protein